MSNNTSYTKVLSFFFFSLLFGQTCGDAQMTFWSRTYSTWLCTV